MADTNNIESKRSKSSPKARSNQIAVCQSFYLHIEIQVKMYAPKAAAGIFQLHIKVLNMVIQPDLSHIVMLRCRVALVSKINRKLTVKAKNYML